MPLSEENELAKRGAAGDTAALQELHAANAPRLKAYFLRSGFRESDADDLTQEVFLLALKALHRFDPALAGFGTWLGTIARNLARKRFRRQRNPLHFDAELADEVLATDGNPGGSPELRERLAALPDCIAALGPELERLVRLRYVEGRTTRGIADASEVSEPTIRLRLKEAMVLIEQCLRRKGLFK